MQNIGASPTTTSSAEVHSCAKSPSSITRAAGDLSTGDSSVELQMDDFSAHAETGCAPSADEIASTSGATSQSQPPADTGGARPTAPIHRSAECCSSDSSDDECVPVVLPRRMCNTSPVVASSFQHSQNPPLHAQRRSGLVFEEGAEADNCGNPAGPKKRPRQKDISRMDRDKVASFDLAVMDPDNKALYRGDQRRKKHRPYEAQKCPRFSNRAESATEIMNMRRALATQCCKYHGQLQFANISMDLISGVRSRYHKQLNNKERQNFLTELWEQRFNRGSWEVNGVPVCYHGVCLLLGISPGCLYEGKQRALWGVELKDNDMMKQKIAIMTQAVRGWIDDFVLRYSEKMPHRSYLHLPSCFTKSQLAQLCRKDISFKTKDEQWRRPSLRLFYSVWAEHFPHVTIPRLSDFSSCNICAKLLQRKIGKNLSIEDKQQLEEDADSEYTLQFLFALFDSPAPRVILTPASSLHLPSSCDYSPQPVLSFTIMSFCLCF